MTDPTFHRPIPWLVHLARNWNVNRLGWFPVELARLEVATVTGHPVAVEVNHGRWIARCPRTECWSAEPVALLDPAFVCATCGEGPRPLGWPAARVAVERLLAARPDPTTRSWTPDEPLDLLYDENLAHGLEVT